MPSAVVAEQGASGADQKKSPAKPPDKSRELTPQQYLDKLMADFVLAPDTKLSQEVKAQKIQVIAGAPGSGARIAFDSTGRPLALQVPVSAKSDDATIVCTAIGELSFIVTARKTPSITFQNRNVEPQYSLLIRYSRPAIEAASKAAMAKRSFGDPLLAGLSKELKSIDEYLKTHR